MRPHSTVSVRIARRPLRILLGLLIACSGTTVTAQTSCEVPLFVKQSSGGANLMILADNSFSMNEAVEHEQYDESIEWPGDFEAETIYYVSKTNNYQPRDFDRNWPSSPSVYLVASENGVDGRYTGNYLNWLFYHATPEQLASEPAVTKIQVLKAVLNSIIDRSNQLRIGVCVYSKTDDGGNLIGQIPKSHNALQAIISGITANASTPTGESLETILDYFGDRTKSPIESPCQYNFVLLMTDGLPTRDLDVSPYLWDADGDGKDPGDCGTVGSPYGNWAECSDHMDDVAWWMANEDVNQHIDGDQHVYTYVVGYDVSAPLLRETAHNGQGLYFEAKNAVELYRSVEFALQDILRRISAGSAVAVVSTERGTDDRLYRGKFMPVDWAGYLECFSLPHQQDDPPLWEAGSFLRDRDPQSREIITAIGSNAFSFTPGNASVLRDELGTADDAEAADLIEWGRGNDIAGYRDRQGWMLGDIISSTPVVVGEPTAFILTESYQEFRAAYADRQRMVYVGANDGMVHGFDADSGREVWAFVPEFALPKFKAMADSFYCHTFTCDQTVTVTDTKLNGSWRTVMVAGGGAGGASLFALDITSPGAPRFLWQADLPHGKTHHSEVEIVTVAERSIALVGSGLDNTDGEAYLYAFDVGSGSHLASILLSHDRGTPRNKATKPAVVDVDLDGEVDLVYVADVLGSVYRLAVGGNSNPARWSVTELYRGSQEITADPVAAYGPSGSIYLYFGTGAYIEDPDMTSSGQNSFVCVYDRHSESTFDKGDLVDQSDSIRDIGGGAGWYVDLWNDDAERVTQRCVVVAEAVIFTSFAPSDDPCVAGGRSWTYQMRYDDGGIPDVDYMDDEKDRSVSIGDGIASYPVADITSGTAIIQSSDATISVQQIAGTIEVMRIRAWQEAFNYESWNLDQGETQ